MAGLYLSPPNRTTPPFLLLHMQPLRTQYRGPTVRFTDKPTEYPVFRNDPPVVVQGRYQPPATPYISTRTLPGTPSLVQRTLERDDKHLNQEESESAQRSDGACGVDDGMDCYSAASTTPTLSNSPADEDAHLFKTSPSPPSPASSSSSSEPTTPSDLSPYLRRFPLKWNVRKKRLKDLSPIEDELSVYAFESRKKSCTVRFIPPDASADSNAWSIEVGPHQDHCPLSVRDVVEAIDNELYQKVELSGLLPSNPRYVAACRERESRLGGLEDAPENVFKNIDFYPEAHRYFHGIEDASGVGYVVRIAQTRSA